MMRVDIWSDVVCPWCYIGKRRFETALAQFPHRDRVEVVWHSFQLDPDAPQSSSETLDNLLARKYGMSRDRAVAAHARVTELAAGEGLAYNLDRARPGNTFDAHRLLHLAADRDLQGAMNERLLRAYFTEGLSIGDADTLVTLAAGVGLDAGEARGVLGGDAYADAVRADERLAGSLGIHGVPFFVLDDTYGVSGAQSSQVLLEALGQAWAETHPLIEVHGAGDGAMCEDESCAVVPARPAGDEPSGGVREP